MLRENLKHLVGIQETSEGRTCDESELEIGSAASSLHILKEDWQESKFCTKLVVLIARKYVFH